MEDVAIKVAELEQRGKSNTHRIDKLEKRQDNLERLTDSISVLANEQEHIKSDVGEIGEAICRGICKGTGVKYIEEEKRMFKDIEGNGLKAEILRAAELGLLQGYGDGTFRPNEPLTRAQAAAVVVRFHDKLKEELK